MCLRCMSKPHSLCVQVSPIPDARAHCCSCMADFLLQVQRVLKPGGKFILSQSNRCFPTKVIHRETNAGRLVPQSTISELFRDLFWRCAGHLVLTAAFPTKAIQRETDDGRLIPKSIHV